MESEYSVGNPAEAWTKDQPVLSLQTMLHHFHRSSAGWVNMRWIHFARHRGREIPNHLKPPLYHTLKGQEGAFRASLSHCLNTGLGARHNESASVLVLSLIHI